MVGINQPGAPLVPIAESWGAFSSPCDGVMWDRNLHGWTAYPADADERPQPEVFSPAELGMEGAKLAAIRRRREMESQARSRRPGDQAQGPCMGNGSEPLAAWPGEVDATSRDAKVDARAKVQNFMGC
eukprot:g15023.t1